MFITTSFPLCLRCSHNVRTVNIIGKTEARARPAVRGMQDVQPLRKESGHLEYESPRLCSVGEVGGIYVRASDLAERYLGSDL